MPATALAQHEPRRRRLDDRQSGDDEADAPHGGERQGAARRHLGAALAGVDQRYDHMFGAGDEVLRAARGPSSPAPSSFRREVMTFSEADFPTPAY